MTDTTRIRPDISNRMRRALVAADKPLCGIWAMLNSSNAVEGLGWSGFDWLLIDCEHSPVELSDVINHLRILETTPTVPIVRLTLNDPLLIKRHLDAGVGSFMLPFVQTAEEARSAVSQMRYPPHGVRGMAMMHRASRYGSAADYLRSAESSLFLIAQIETKQALSNMDEILAVDGVDAVFFGPSDLSASLGQPGQAGGDMVTSVITGALGRVRASGKYAGVLAVNDVQAHIFLEAGFDFVSVANDCALLFGNARQVAAKFASAGLTESKSSSC
jgi:4-hydroxy-2-oxoheptanedioate aldolase